ncbi:endonuclease VII domain-containing protein [Nonomuraea sp. H19]|uniref:endonuclease VII domain-containing protein n=1 Tax=Nonomuraea sp. H19 TaxID=3452206 RepID=UPI003F8BC7B9
MDAPDGLTRCPDCGETKAVSEFGLDKRMADGRARYRKVCFRRRSTFGGNRSSEDGLTAYCTPCHTVVMRDNEIKNLGSDRNHRLRLRYGITEDDVERMLARQGGLCAFCRAVPGAFADHRHQTGQVRGVLCVNCDNGLGHFGDNTVLLELAARYPDGEILWPEFVILPKRRGADSVAPTRACHLSQRYRLRQEDAERMAVAQLGSCVVCRDRPPEHADHCQRTGDVRYA